MTPLEELIRTLIEAEGPIGLDRYMALCLGHPQYGYYMGRDPFGAKGDFITAPEVSQVFGELLGVWCIAAWQAMGAPAEFQLVELGPGRGTLMADMLRTARKAAPGFAEAARIHLVETSPVLRQMQRRTLDQTSSSSTHGVGEGDRVKRGGGMNVQWHDGLETVPEGPAIFIGNEFFDAIPIRQFERRDGEWYERVVGLKDGAPVLGLVAADVGSQGQDGDIIEFAPARSDMAREIGERLKAHPGAALFIDYGHGQTAPGDTLQAMRGHRYVSILDRPGESDLTSHVDFEALGKAFAQGGAVVHPVLTQRAFLLAMGLEQRIAMLAAKSDLHGRAILERQMTRLAGPDQMGNLFKVLCAASPELPTPYPFGRR